MAEYVEPSAFVMDGNRPEFQKMIERATDDDRPFDVILVHSFSRFFRDAFGLEMYIRRLAKAGVRLVSATQELGDDPAQVMMRQVIALFDEYQSRENAKHVLSLISLPETVISLAIAGGDTDPPATSGVPAGARSTGTDSLADWTGA